MSFTEMSFTKAILRFLKNLMVTFQSAIMGDLAGTTPAPSSSQTLQAMQSFGQYSGGWSPGSPFLRQPDLSPRPYSACPALDFVVYNRNIYLKCTRYDILRLYFWFLVTKRTQ
jgi:hypothetical protein